MRPSSAAGLLAAPLVAAVDRGQAGQVAAFLHLLWTEGRLPLLMWLLQAAVHEVGRPDAAAEAAWSVIRHGDAGEQQNKGSHQAFH